MDKKEIVINAMRRYSSFTKTELAMGIGQPLNTVTWVISALLKSKYVKVIGSEPQSGFGRPRCIYKYLENLENDIEAHPVEIPQVPTEAATPIDDSESELQVILDKIATKDQMIRDLRIQVESEKIAKAKISSELKKQHEEEVTGLRYRLNLLNDKYHAQEEDRENLLTQFTVTSKELQEMKDRIEGYRKLDSLIKKIGTQEKNNGLS